VEFEAIDEQGTTIFHSGYLKPDQLLDESAHVYKAILLDEESRPITRHQIWLTNAKGTTTQSRPDGAMWRVFAFVCRQAKLQEVLLA
jgi:hypothetical protein